MGKAAAAKTMETQVHEKGLNPPRGGGASDPRGEGGSSPGAVAVMAVGCRMLVKPLPLVFTGRLSLFD